MKVTAMMLPEEGEAVRDWLVQQLAALPPGNHLYRGLDQLRARCNDALAKEGRLSTASNVRPLPPERR